MRPIGSEKIQNPDDKLARILEIAGIKKESVTESKSLHGKLSNVLHEAVAANGTEYAIVQEEKYVYIKAKKNDDYEYLTGVQNINEHSYRSYADALKHLNLMFKEINEQVGLTEGIDVLKKKSLDERYVLRLNKKDNSNQNFTEPSDNDTSGGFDASTSPDISDLEADLVGQPNAGEQPSTQPDQETPVDNAMEPQTDNQEGEDPLKTIQKMVGKVTQKMREMGERLQPKDVKYILNSLISAADMTKVPESDKNDIINKILGKDEDSVNEVNYNEMAEPKKGFSYEFAAWFTGTVLNTVQHPRYGKHQLTADQVKYSDEEYKNNLYKTIQSAIQSGQIESPNQTMNEIGIDSEVPSTARFRASGGPTVAESEEKNRILTILEQARLKVHKGIV